jgi:predicted ABC-type ATPase
LRDKPNLVVVAGCNGSGKSTFSSLILPKHFSIFDADRRKKEIYDSFTFDFELRDEMAWNNTNQEFKQLVLTSIAAKSDFAYETNFNSEPLFWVEKFKKAGYTINLLYFCLENTDLAKERVAIRFENGGHYVNDKEVENRYISGFENLNKSYEFFDAIFLLETSTNKKAPKLIVEYQKGQQAIVIPPLPSYLKLHCPDFLKAVSNHD